MKPGANVGAKRWPYAAAHPDCWEQPWSGTLLALDDPRAWAGTIAFPEAQPTRAAVRRHLAKSEPSERVPVLWDFGAIGLVVQWEQGASLRPYEADVAAWETARAAARMTARVSSRVAA